MQEEENVYGGTPDTEEVAVASVGAEDRKDAEKEVSTVLGKFKDVDALLSAYNSLEAEFTTRCQKIKQLESALSSVDKQVPTEEVEEKVVTQPQKDITEQEKEQILKEYLTGVMKKKQTAIVMDGEGVGTKTPVTRPKTITEAGNIARELFASKKIN